MGATCDSGASTSQTIAYTLDSSGFVSLFSYIMIPYGFLFDVFIFKQTFIPMQLLSAVFILAVTMAVTYLKLRDKQRQQAESETTNTDLK